MSGALGLFLAALLAVSAGHKVLARQRLIPVTARLAGTTEPFGTLLLVAAASLEALAAIAMLIPPFATGGAIAAAALWLAYGAALAGHHGERLDCGCDLAARVRPVDALAIGRPVLLAALAGTVALQPATGYPLDAPFAALALLSLWFAAGELHSIPTLARIRP